MNYCEFYCNQDVNVSRIGFNAFREYCLNDPINEDVFIYISLPLLAYRILCRDILILNGIIRLYRGPVQHYLQGFFRGGRCMSANNKCLHIKDKKLFDFDACSLYPSAMRRMFTVEGPIEYMKFDSDIWYDYDNMPDILIMLWMKTKQN